MLIYFKGTVVNKGGKAENKDYKLFAPTAVIVQTRGNAGNPSPMAIVITPTRGNTTNATPMVSCKDCESWTTEVVKFINRSKTSGPAKTN